MHSHVHGLTCTRDKGQGVARLSSPTGDNLAIVAEAEWRWIVVEKQMVEEVSARLERNRRSIHAEQLAMRDCGIPVQPERVEKGEKLSA